MKSFKIRATFAVSALAALVGASCSGNNAPPPAAYFSSTLGTNPNDLASTMTCPYKSPGEPFFTVGTLNGSTPVPISDGASVDGNKITVSCQVDSAGNNTYNVQLSVSQGSIGGITLFATSPISDTPGPQNVIQAVFTSAVAGTGIPFNSPTATPCSFTLSTQGNPPITAGRIWGTLTCPLLSNVGDSNATCFGQATLLFQNCT